MTFKKDGAGTLEDILYTIRDNIGELQIKLLESLDSGPPLRTTTRLRDVFGHEYLQSLQESIVKAIRDIALDKVYSEQIVPDQQQGVIDDAATNLEALAVRIPRNAKVQDVIDLREAGKKFYDALHPIAVRVRDVDALTRLKNIAGYRAALIDGVRQWIENPHRKISVARIDLNNFSAFNDQADHECGDVALQHAADLLKEEIGGIHSRPGGDEFATILRGADPMQATEAFQRYATAVDEKLLQKIMDFYNAEGKKTPDRLAGLWISASIGISSTDTLEGRDLYHRALNHITDSESPSLRRIRDIAYRVTEQKDPTHLILRQIHNPAHCELLVKMLSDQINKEADRASHLAKKQGIESVRQERETTYRDFYKHLGAERAQRMARFLVKEPSTVAIYDPNIPEQDYSYNKER